MNNIYCFQGLLAVCPGDMIFGVYSFIFFNVFDCLEHKLILCLRKYTWTMNIISKTFQRILLFNDTSP